jgi:hypothetical protein
MYAKQDNFSFQMNKKGDGEPIISDAPLSLSADIRSKRVTKEIPHKIGTRPEKYTILGSDNPRKMCGRQ